MSFPRLKPGQRQGISHEEVLKKLHQIDEWTKDNTIQIQRKAIEESVAKEKERMLQYVENVHQMKSLSKKYADSAPGPSTLPARSSSAYESPDVASVDPTVSGSKSKDNYPDNLELYIITCCS